jgi:hypothetical protein
MENLYKAVLLEIILIINDVLSWPIIRSSILCIIWYFDRSILSKIIKRHNNSLLLPIWIKVTKRRRTLLSWQFLELRRYDAQLFLSHISASMPNIRPLELHHKTKSVYLDSTLLCKNNILPENFWWTQFLSANDSCCVPWSLVVPSLLHYLCLLFFSLSHCTH